MGDWYREKPRRKKFAIVCYKKKTGRKYNLELDIGSRRSSNQFSSTRLCTPALINSIKIVCDAENCILMRILHYNTSDMNN